MPRSAPEKISKDTERKLLGYLDKVAEHIGTGDSPNQAIIKVARDDDVELGHVRLLAQAYNNARSNQQRKGSEDLYEKLASFKLADIKVISQELYPDHVKTAATEEEHVISDDYQKTPPSFSPYKAVVFEKAASLLEPRAQTYPKHEKDYVHKKAYSLLKEMSNEYHERRRVLNEAHDKVAQAYDELRYHFKLASNGGTFHKVAADATAYFGPRAQVLMNNVLKDMPHLKKQASQCNLTFNRNVEPYNTIAKCLTFIQKHAELKKEFEQYATTAAEKAAQFHETFVNERPAPIYGSIVKKADNPLSSLGSQIGSIAAEKPIIGALQKGMGKPENKLKTEAYMAVTDPMHDSKLRAMRSQAMLSDMMANDPFLSGEQPERVTGLYNQITKLSPRSADQPLLMRALLRRYLAQGQVDPHDIDQLVGIEGKIKQRDEPTKDFNLPKLPADFTQSGGPPRRED